MALSSESRDRILAKLRAGGLPRKGLTKMYAGYGRGYRCTACVPDDHAVRHRVRDGLRWRVSYRMHSHCGALWQAESEQRDGSSTSAEMAADGYEPTR